MSERLEDFSEHLLCPGCGHAHKPRSDWGFLDIGTLIGCAACDRYFPVRYWEVLSCTLDVRFSDYHERQLELRARSRSLVKGWDGSSFGFLFHSDADVTAPCHGDRILTREQWDELKARIEAFYDIIPACEIEAYNTRERPVEERFQLEGLDAARDAVRQRVGSRKDGIYLLRDQDGLYKIGRSENIPSRFAAHCRGRNQVLEFIHFIRAEDLKAAETWLLERYRAKNVRGEWFQLDPEDVEWLVSIERLPVQE